MEWLALGISILALFIAVSGKKVAKIEGKSEKTQIIPTSEGYVFVEGETDSSLMVVKNEYGTYAFQVKEGKMWETTLDDVQSKRNEVQQ
jgi:hypothetical protein